MISFLMLGSLALGLIAWIFPVINLIKINKHNNRNWIVFSVLSVSACSISLFFQIFYNNYLVRLGDWSSLIDTTRASTLLSAVLLFVTIILNIITLISYRYRTIS
jgi:hypothetical protein